MKIVGKGHPMDPFNHEIGTRTSELMTDGPYKICRNPDASRAFDILYRGSDFSFMRRRRLFLLHFLLLP